MIDDFRAPRRPKSLPVDQNQNLPQRQTASVEPFQTPEQAAVRHVPVAPEPVEAAVLGIAPAPAIRVSDIDMSLPATDISKSTKPLHKKFVLHWPPHKKEWLVGVAVIVLVTSGAASWLLMHHTPKAVVAATPTVKVVKKAPPQPTTVASNLSGLPVDPSANQRPVTAAMIENSEGARPQAGLSAASVIFEAVAEGGVTRFMALYQDTQPTNIGPIRSARPYYVQWALGFQAAYAHVGGSPDALNDIKAWKVRDLNQFYNGGSYHRITSRQAPHNVYTGVPTLQQLAISKGYTTSTFTTWARKKDSPLATPTARTISMSLSGPYYNPTYTYNAATNSYNRAEGGAPQTDSNTNTQLSPKVVIAIVVPESRGALDSSGAYYSNYNPLGSGKAYVFQDGTVTIDQWTKASNTDQITFTDSTNQPVKLNAGQTWVTAVTGPDKLVYKP